LSHPLVFGEERAIDMKGFCKKFTDPLMLCESCTKIAKDRQTVTFHDFGLNLSLARAGSPLYHLSYISS
jgi:hypothetical protein